jgi:hypothetical protein
MSGGLRNTWEFLAAELWEPLADYTAKDAIAPSDFFSDLFAAVDEFLSPRPTDTELVESRNDPDKARQRFLALKGTDFTSESAIVHFLEETREVVADYEILGFENCYRRHWATRSASSIYAIGWTSHLHFVCCFPVHSQISMLSCIDKTQATGIFQRCGMTLKRLSTVMPEVRVTRI